MIVELEKVYMKCIKCFSLLTSIIFFTFKHRPVSEKISIHSTISLKTPTKTTHMKYSTTVAFICLWAMTMWYVYRKRNIQRTGRHKKYDSERSVYRSL